MAYSLITALAKQKGYGQRWLEVDFTTVIIKDIFAVYQAVVLTLENEFLTEPVYLDLIAHGNNLPSFMVTIPAWLVTNSDAALPTTDSAPAFELQHVLYRDALRSNYDITRVTPDGHPTSSSIESDRIDLLLTRSNTDYIAMGTQCLVAVNGLVHRTEGTVDGLIVRHGSASANVANATHVGILSFASISDFTIIPITAEMLYKQNERQSFTNCVYIDTGVELLGKTPILVIGGHLQLPKRNPLYQVVGDTQLKVDIAKLGLAQLVFGLVRTMDIQDLRPYFTGTDIQQIQVADLHSDEFIIKLLTLTQSFVVLVNTPDLFAELEMVASTDLCGSFVTAIEPLYPLMTDSGRIEPYWTTESWGYTILNTPSNLRPRYRFETTDWVNNAVVDDALSTTEPYTYDTGYFVKLGAEVLVL